jgi:hypothetical protein
MVKWRLVVKTLPWVGLVLVLSHVRRSVLNIPPLVEFDDIGAVLTAAALIMGGFMLAGVISDYKESEKLPGELASTWKPSTMRSRRAPAPRAGSRPASSEGATRPSQPRWSSGS